eukprot:224907_1
MTVFLFVDFECWRCTGYVNRRILADDSAIIGLWCYLWVAVILTPVCLYLLVACDVFQNEVSTSRDLHKMIISQDWDGILEMQLYVENYGIYDQTQKKTLLMLAMEQRRAAIITFLLNKIYLI